jgi:hypothetical protein
MCGNARAVVPSSSVPGAEVPPLLEPVVTSLTAVRRAAASVTAVGNDNVSVPSGSAVGMRVQSCTPLTAAACMCGLLRSC